MKAAVLALLGIGLSLGAPPATTPVTVSGSAVGHKTQPPLEINDAQADKWLRTWQKRLTLEDWDVEVRIVRTSDLNPATLGNLKWNVSTKTATIRVLSPADYDLPSADVAADIEYTIVHELVHLQLAGLPRDPTGKQYEERVVNKISEALFALEQGPAYKPRAQVAHLAPKDHSNFEASRSQ